MHEELQNCRTARGHNTWTRCGGTNFLNPGKLVLPFHMDGCLTKDLFHLYQHISREAATRYALFGCINPILAEEEDQLATLQCSAEVVA
ncbi:hypothetical protein E2C01_052333 [Portunus trituberculatus]|uniref:Uncharacterized protein n=1 Tax=Portunus trituberculatus TaxID=210409 RepID=A0A5B7GP35_PORTR|nr:hypothetical protein [Portunus trituberculatus]